ncbi:MAG: ATP-binding protein, partial [Hyphomicrobiaceae bacterium]
MDARINPFTPGAGSQPPELAGRSSVLNTAATTLARIGKRRHSRSVLLYGLRGVGKTVLLNRIRKLADEAGYYSAPLEAPEERRLADLLAPPLRRLILQLDMGEGAKQKVRRALGALRAFASVFDVKIGDVAIQVKPPLGVADSGTLDSDIVDLLVAVGEAAAEPMRWRRPRARLL